VGYWLRRKQQVPPPAFVCNIRYSKPNNISNISRQPEQQANIINMIHTPKTYKILQKCEIH